MQKAVIIAQITISALIIVVILMQNRGSGVSAIFGGGSGGGYRTKRGLEKGLHIFTIILVILFVAVGIVSLIITE